MNICELQTLLITLTKSNISQTKIAEAFGTTRSNISLRMKNKSLVTNEELEKTEKFFNISLSGNEQFNIVNNCLAEISMAFNIDDKDMLVIETLLKNKKALKLARNFIDALQGDEGKAEAVIGILKIPELAKTFIE